MQSANHNSWKTAAWKTAAWKIAAWKIAAWSVIARLAVGLLLSSLLMAQGVDLKPGGLVLFGSASATSCPASIDFKLVKRATPEWKTIRADGVRKGSGRYDLLLAEMNERICKAVCKAAEAGKRDCVFRRRDLKKANGLRVVSLTKAVLAQL